MRKRHKIKICRDHGYLDSRPVSFQKRLVFMADELDHLGAVGHDLEQDPDGKGFVYAFGSSTVNSIP